MQSPGDNQPVRSRRPSHCFSAAGAAHAALPERHGPLHRARLAAAVQRRQPRRGPARVQGLRHGEGMRRRQGGKQGGESEPTAEKMPSDYPHHHQQREDDRHQRQRAE